ARPHPSDRRDDEVPPAARPQSARPEPGLPARAETEESRALTGNRSGSPSGRHERKPAARKKRDAGKARASDEDILKHARRIHGETGSVGRDRVEDALRAAGYTVSSDGARRVVREFKAQLKAVAGHPPR